MIRLALALATLLALTGCQIVRAIEAWVQPQYVERPK